jgi:hypothetical protein
MALRFLAGLAASASSTHAATHLVARTGGLLRGLGRADAEQWARADRFLVSGSGFVTILLFARYLDLATFGAFMLAYTALLLLMAAQKSLVSEPHRILGAALSEPQRRRHTGSAAVLQGLGALSLCAALCAAGGLTAVLYSPPAGDVLVALAVTVVPWLMQDFQRRALHARARSRDAAINTAVTQALQIFGAAALCSMAAPWATPVSALSVLAMATLVGSIVGMWQLQPLVDFGRTGEEYRRAWTESWRCGRGLAAQNGSAWLGVHGPSWVVALLLGVEQFGLYRAVAHLAHAADPFLQAAEAPAGAKTMLLLLLTPLVAVLVFLPESALAIAYGEKFTGTAAGAILLLAAAAHGLGHARIALDRRLAESLPAQTALVQWLPVVVVLILAAALVQFFGVPGAPMAVLCINLALLVAAWVACRRRSPAPTGP